MLNSNLNTLTYADLKAEEKKLLERLSLIKSATTALETLCDAKSEPPKEAQQVNGISRVEGSFANVNTHDGAVILLKELGKPVSTKEVFKGFKKRGKIITSKQPMVSIYNGLDGATQRRDSKLIKLGGGVWGLKGRDEERKLV
jgi:hypothetical protein